MRVNIRIQEVVDPREAQRILARFREPVAALEAMGFRRLGVADERSRELTVFLSLPLMWLKHEASRLTRDLCVSVRSPLLESRDGTTVAMPFALGVKFYSEFSDGSVLITGSFASHAGGDRRDEGVYYGSVPGGDLGAALAEHVRRQQALAADGRELRGGVDFAAYVRMSYRE